MSLPRMCDYMMVSPEVPDEIKEVVRSSIVVIGDNVSNYFWEGTEQEYWNEKDFPNLAPPFRRFFVECRAPKQVISEVTGIQKWRGIARWGCLFGYSDARKVPGNVKERRSRMIEDINEMWQETASLREELEFLSESERLDWIQNLSDWERSALWTLYIQARASLQPSTLFDFMAWAKRKGIRWIAQAILFIQEEKAGFVSPPVGDLTLFISKSGEIVPINPPSGWFISLFDPKFALQGLSMKQANQLVLPLYETCLLTVCFMNCRNVTMSKEVVHYPKKWRRRFGRPEPIRYHVLKIDSMRKVLAIEGKSEEVGLRKALHICRGHFKDYRKSGLFGRHHGIYWWDAHVRGSLQRGVVLKDYDVRRRETSHENETGIKDK